MNKGQLVEAVAGQLGSRAAAEEAVDAVLDVMVRAVVAGDRVQVTGFGTLEPVERAGRYARNPQTGERVRVKKTTVPRFRPGQGFKDLVSGARKLPKSGPSVAKAPKGSLTMSKTMGSPAAGRPAAKRAAGAPAAAKKTATRKTATAARKTTATAKKTAPAAKKAAPRGGRKTATAKRAGAGRRSTN
ncbi:HU family DNA-binding protein [Kitasatospora sp. NPDC094015]|uniref:HU family DNA-binding protein n=1 Tax=Kitasatospora sp. NPDC094015 TaxID=3155205 RepID=UPI003316F49E